MIGIWQEEEINKWIGKVGERGGQGNGKCPGTLIYFWFK